MSAGLIAENPLNPTLYAALKKRFGRVIFANQGSAAAPAFPSAFATRDGTMRIGTDRTAWGEYYRVCCPHCQDGQFRLWVNHLYGTRNENGGYNSNLVICYHKGCLQNPANSKEFYESLYGLVNRNDRGRMLVRAGEENLGELKAVAPPGVIMPINQVSHQNQARQYMVSRGFDLDELVKDYQIGVVMEPEVVHYGTRGRIYIPIRMAGELVGWQARYPADVHWKDTGIQKYLNLTGMIKKLMLYNWHVAQHWPFLCVCEGITSAWRIGGPAVAIFGNTISIPQRQFIREMLGKPLFLMVEAGSEQRWADIGASLQQDGHQTVIPIMFPRGFDPANYEHHVVVDIIRAAAAQANVSLIQW